MRVSFSFSGAVTCGATSCSGDEAAITSVLTLGISSTGCNGDVGLAFT